MSGAKDYANWVIDPANSIRTGRLMKLAANRFLSDLKRTDIEFNEAEANKMIGFSEGKCCLWEDKWQGQPMDMRPWMLFIFQQIYGWIRKKDGLRRVQKVYIQIAKKNAKTTLSGITGAYHLLGDFRVKTPKVFVGANNEDQAKLCVNITGKIIQESPQLAKYTYGKKPILRLFNYKENIVNVVLDAKGKLHRQGFIKALSKEGSDNTSKTSGGKHGINPSLGIIDEYGMSPDDNLLNTLQSAQAAREEPLIMCITTAGYIMDGPCFTKLRHSGVGILEGTMEDDSYLPFIFEIDPPEDGITIEWLLSNEDVWEQANPNIDVSVFRDFLRRELNAAKNEGGTKEVSVKTLNFNMWVNSPVFLYPQRFGIKIITGLKLIVVKNVMLDWKLVQRGQISALALLFPGDILKVRMLFFIAEDYLKLDDSYQKSKEFIKIDKGNVIETELAVNWIVDELQKYQVHSICFPVQQETNSVVQGVLKSGYNGKTLSQMMKGISNATSEWETMLTGGKVDHAGNPILKYHNSNCMAIRKEGGIRLEKNGKVLGIYACLNAFALWKEVNADGVKPETEFTLL